MGKIKFAYTVNCGHEYIRLIRVFDGAKTYIQMWSEMRNRVSPVFVVRPELRRIVRISRRAGMAVVLVIVCLLSLFELPRFSANGQRQRFESNSGR